MDDSHAERGRIEAALSELLGACDMPARLREAMGYSLLAPGKRFRPRLTMMACQAAGGVPASAIFAGAAVEMIHAYSLIHDDLPAMDDDDLRRGRPTCHKVFGEALAILAGDALQTLAFQTLAERYPPRTAAAACGELARAAGASGMVGGQVLDMAWETKTDGSVADLEVVHLNKTGALIRAALRIGGLVAQAERADGPEPATMDALDEYGRAVGLLFQLTDDLLDVEGDAAHAGKRVGKDADRGKLTYPGLIGVDASRRLANELYCTATAALVPLGSAADRLNDLARSVRDRDR